MGVLRHDNVRSAVEGTRRTAIRDLASMICLRPDELMFRFEVGLHQVDLEFCQY